MRGFLRATMRARKRNRKRRPGAARIRELDPERREAQSVVRMQSHGPVRPTAANMPVAYIPRTRELYRDFTPYRWVVNDTVPWTPLRKPVRECRLALISSGGIMYRDQPRWHREDASWRRIPKSARREELSIWHFGYQTRDAQEDTNCVFPLERLRELEADGVVGELCDPAFSFMGGIYSARKVRDELAPGIVDELKRAHADAFFLVPA